MNNITLTGTGLLPVSMSKQKLNELFNRLPFAPWQTSLNSDEVKDKRRFFNRISAEIFRPIDENRWKLDITGTKLSHLKLVDEDGLEIAHLVNLELLQLDDLLFIYYTVKSENLSEDEAYIIQRKIFSFFPKTNAAQMPQWTTKKASQSLIQWFEQLLDMKLELSDNYVEDWMGHELPYCLHIETKDSDKKDLLINFAAGADPNRLNYQISQQEHQRLEKQIFSVWNDWHCLQNHHRLVFCSQPDAGALRANLFEHKYYIDLYVLALYQRIKYAHFQEQFSRANRVSFQVLLQDIKDFRKHYQLAHVTTYPLAQRLYNYLTECLELRKLEAQVFKEIDFHNNEEQREQAGNYNAMLFSISVIAAIVLPLNSLSTLFAISPEQRDWLFWLTSGLSGIGILVLMLMPVWWRKRRLNKGK